MIVLTDTREWSDRLLAGLRPAPLGDEPIDRYGPAGPPRVEEWRDLSSSELLPVEQPLWEALSSDPELSLCEVATDPGLGFWDYLVIIDQAAGSQFDILRGLDPARLPGSVACVAITGYGFHGHHGRSWVTQRGNLHLCTLCDPDLDAARCGLAMTTLPAVAVIDALIEEGSWSSRPGIKWVNDILIGEKKVAGVLTATQSMHGRLTALTLGIGLNIESTPRVAATPFVPAAGCLTGCLADQQTDQENGDGSVTVGSLLAGCLRAVSGRLEGVRQQGPEPLIQAYRDNSLVVGRHVAIWPDHGDPQAEVRAPVEPLALGVVQSIGPDLSLTLTGHPEPIRCGRLAFQPD